MMSPRSVENERMIYHEKKRQIAMNIHRNTEEKVMLTMLMRKNVMNVEKEN